jgi:ABC-type nitrate/sulfonate/bicarbonate transport system substrate-binding protein
MRRSSLALGLATSVLGACAKTPPPPAECPLIQVSVDWENFHPIPLQIDLDSLGSLIARTKEDGARAHMAQEFVFAANRLDLPARRAALASVAKALERAGKQ